MIRNRTARRCWRQVGTRIVTLFLCFALTPFALQADWINLTGAETAPNIAEISVFDDRVEVALEVYVGDLATFEEPVPADWLKDSDRQPPALEERLRRFTNGGLQFATDTGEKLQAELRLPLTPAP